MSKLNVFIEKPVMAVTLALFILIMGALGYWKLPVRLFPLVPSEYITITTTYPGASAQTMEGFVSTPIQDAMVGLDGLDYIDAQNTQGKSVINLKFKLIKGAIDKALPQVSDRVSSVRWKLPKNINSPVITKVNPNGGPGQAVLYYAFNSNTLNRGQITDYLIRNVQSNIESVKGVGGAGIYGKRKFAIQVWLDPKKMAAFGISASDVLNALRNQNVQATAGKLKGEFLQFNIKAKTGLSTADEFDNLVIKGGSHPIRIRDIGDAILGASQDVTSAYVMSKPAVVMGITLQSNANAIAVSERIRNKMKDVKANLPPDIQTKLLADMSVFNKQSVHEVRLTIVEASIFVFLVILLFLGSLRSVAIPIVTIPLSLLGGCALMYAFGFSANSLTLLAWVLAIGLVVDDAIVVLENIHRHLEMGKTRKEAAIESLKEIKSAIFIITVTVATVFVPIGFIPGISGALFSEFAFTLSMVVVISGVLALVLTPMMCAYFMPSVAKESKFAHYADHFFDKFRRGYKHVLSEVLHIRWLFVLIFILLLGGGYELSKKIPSQLIPPENTGILIGIGLGQPNANLDYLQTYSTAFDTIYKSMPIIQSYGVFSGWPAGVNQTVSFGVLDPSVSGAEQDKVLGELMGKMENVSGLYSFALRRPTLPGASFNTGVSFVLKTSNDYASLAQAADALKTAAEGYPGLIMPSVNLKLQNIQVDVEINRNKAAILGISEQEIADALATFYAKPIVNWFNYAGRSYEVLPQVYRAFRYNPKNLNLVYLKTHSGELVPLSSIASISESVVPNTLNEFAQEHSALLTAQIAPGYTQSEGLAYLENFVKTKLSNAYSYDYKYKSRQYVQSKGVLLTAFVFAIILIYLMLSAFFNSLREPLIVMISVPLAIVGALFTMHMADVTLNIYTQIGLIMLVGLVSKHGILIVHFANDIQKTQLLPPREAVIEAASIRLRAILMTTLAMIAGSLPLVTASGAGALARENIGWVIIGGMALGTCLTLFIVPTAYTLLGKNYNVHRIKK